MRCRAALVLGALTALAACAPRTPPAAPELPPGPPPGVDGRYSGTARLVRGDRACPRSGHRYYQVVNGVVSLSYSAGGRARVQLSADIQPDGHFQATDGVGVLDGQLRDGMLEITVSSQQCEHHWTLRKAD